MMLLYEPPDPSLRDGWFGGRRFQKQPREPIVVEIQPKSERSELLPYFGTATLMRNDFYDALREAGVDNMDVYEAVIQTEDGSIRHQGYKAFNLIGVVRAADLRQTVFNDPPASRLIDASISKLEIDPNKAKGLLMFRLAEYVGAVVVHRKVKEAIGAKRFPHVEFTDPGEYVS
ncbi:MAG: hypothetical protein NTAFB01_26450 [Nitrospira sp.]